MKQEDNYGTKLFKRCEILELLKDYYVIKNELKEIARI